MFIARNTDSLAIRLEKGEDVHTSIIAACQQHSIQAGFVVSGIGMLQDPELGFFVGQGEYDRKAFPGNHELLNLSGNISIHGDGLMAHLHAMLANEDYSVFGGHLFAAEVGLTLEVQISIADKAHMYRRVEEETGLPGLYISQL